MFYAGCLLCFVAMAAFVVGIVLLVKKKRLAGALTLVASLLLGAGGFALLAVLAAENLAWH